MCHLAHVHVRLSAEEKKNARKLAGVLFPIYASLLLAVFALAAVNSGSRQSELVASASAPAAVR